jgi:hypothetical protein
VELKNLIERNPEYLRKRVTNSSEVWLAVILNSIRKILEFSRQFQKHSEKFLKLLENIKGVFRNYCSRKERFDSHEPGDCQRDLGKKRTGYQIDMITGYID